MVLRDLITTRCAAVITSTEPVRCRAEDDLEKPKWLPTLTLTGIRRISRARCFKFVSA